MQLQDGSVGKVINNLSQVLARVVGDQSIFPHLHKKDHSAHVIEKFSHYVGRQMGFLESEVPAELCRLADEYLIKPKECVESILEYLAHQKDPTTLCQKLIDEFDRCILSYFAFNWNQASYMISQVLSVESPQKIRLKKILLEATREQRFERVTKNLKVARVFSTLVEEMKAIKVDSQKTNDIVHTVHTERSPVLLLMGGGMGAGKSTVLKDILKESFWSGASSNAVVVEADAFKESDVIYRALSSRGHHDDMIQTAELVHQSSTDAASSLLVTALNEGRDVIMDGTLSWEPFVEQTIAMARNVHKHRYRMGVGYKVSEDGTTITEDYWEQVNEEEEEHQSEENCNGEPRTRKPYRIELVGVVCDGYLAVVRGIRRAIMTGRAVRVNSQLKSHKRFANAFPRFCKLVDDARLYCTNDVGGPPQLKWRKDDDQNLPYPKDIKCLERIGSVNVEADSIYELYKEPSPIMEPGSVWKDIVLSPSRSNDQKELKESIQKIEKFIRKRSIGKVFKFTHVLAASFAGLVAAAAASSYRRAPSTVVGEQKKVIPELRRTESGRLGEIEKFSHYVARQMGFEDADEVPELCILAQEYLKKSKGCDESIFEYISSGNVENTDSLYAKLVEELERCILSYLAFHWNQATSVISQVLGVESQQKKKLKGILLAATREQRFDRVTKNLKVTRVISTLVEEMKAINGDSQCTEVMVPMAHSERSPVLLFMGGGMGAGKSTVLKDILKESFWSGAASNAVVVEADAFKESDVIYRALSSRGHHDDMLQTAELVHQSSTDAASSLLVTALNEGRDVIMDGTLSWEPFVEQTIAMARNVHKHRYRMGVGYKVAEDGTITENYWEQVNDAEEHQSEEISNGEAHTQKPYRIELVGVVCDGYLAVVRGIRRAIMTGRAVRVNSQLKSHKRFANAFPRYCKLVDNARLYCTNAVGGPPKLIGRKDGDHNLLVDREEIKCLETLGSLNAGADSIYELHKEPSPIMEPGSVWNDIVMSPSRPSDQKELKESIQKIEKSIRKM
ncbi:hypothetical protein JHK82_056986 [Glycine max]|nr:hypothetical protein JHK82_056986 [Glycine max]